MVIAAIFILGLIFGSFINALVWRLYEQTLPKKRRVASDRELSISRGRSMCPECQHTLAAKDLVPVLSWLSLKGRCRYCHMAIGAQYPLVELLTGMVFAVCHVFGPAIFTESPVLYPIYYTLLIIMIALAVYDARWFLLPNRLVYPFNLLALTFVGMLAYVQKDVQAVVWSALSSLLLYAIFRALYEISNGQWIGYGDVRLAVGLGLLAGSPTQVLIVLFVASLFGIILYVPSLLRGQKVKGVQLPFGPHLLLGSYLVFLWGEPVLRWYTGTLV